ncbi:GmrSD restriction endonuclease domain-containing protein [Mycobacterium paraintracellulare]
MAEASSPIALTVRSESIQSAYSSYRLQRYSVNRRYQRKLVWSVEEKQQLIDSILLTLPLPLFLLAEISSSGDPTLELIDGMQRLNAIFSFIEQEFDYHGSYFDLDTLADTKALKDAGTVEQRTPVLSREQSVALSNYSLALSVFRSSDDAAVEDIFRRINSGGRRLSKQELRQAGATSELADVIREISSVIRGDSSREQIVPLSIMPLLSISNRQLNYGISVSDVFWVRQSILRSNDIRESLDEQVILDIVLDCLIEPMAPTTGKVRDAAYSFEGAENDPGEEPLVATSADITVATYGKGELIHDFLLIYEQIRETLDSGEDGFSKLIGLRPSGRSARYFHALFVALWEYRFKESPKRQVHDLVLLYNKLRGIHNAASITTGGDWPADSKRQSIDAFKGIIGDALQPISESEEDPRRFGWSIDLEALLTHALIEQQALECKQGLYRLDSQRQYDPQCLTQILETITAISNIGPTSTGYIILGVADKPSDAARIREIDNVASSEYRGFHIVGIERESRLRGDSMNDYWQWILQQIGSSPKLPSWLREAVARNARLIRYRSKPVGVLKIEPAREVAFYDETELFERRGSETIRVPPGTSMVSVIQRFA